MSEMDKDVWAAINSIRDKVEDVRVHGCSRSAGEVAMAQKLANLEEKLTEFMLEMTKEVGAIRKSMSDGLHDLKLWFYGFMGTIAVAFIGYVADKFLKFP